MKLHASLVMVSQLFAFPVFAADLQRYEFSEPHMGTMARVVIYSPRESIAKEAAKAAFARVAALNGIMSDYDPESELMRLCKAGADGAGKPVQVSPDLYFVLSEGQRVARRSDGAFDVTIGPMVRLWRQSRRTQRLPSAQELATAKSSVGYAKLELNDHDRTVRFLAPSMQLDLGGIAKGFAVDEMLAAMKKHGIDRALASLGGDIAVGNAPSEANGWTIDVAPLTRLKSTHRLTLRNAAVSTSGDREQYTIIDGVRYSHIVDPRTGLGQTGRRSVTVIAQRGITADSTTKAIALMQPTKALELIDEVPGGAALIVLKLDGGEQVIESKRLAKYLAAK